MICTRKARQSNAAPPASTRIPKRPRGSSPSAGGVWRKSPTRSGGAGLDYTRSDATRAEHTVGCRSIVVTPNSAVSATAPVETQTVEKRRTANRTTASAPTRTLLTACRSCRCAQPVADPRSRVNVGRSAAPAGRCWESCWWAVVNGDTLPEFPTPSLTILGSPGSTTRSIPIGAIWTSTPRSLTNSMPVPCSTSVVARVRSRVC